MNTRLFSYLPFALLASLALAIPAFASDPIPGVDVHLTKVGGAPMIVQTGADGSFHFTNLTEGTYKLWISRDAAIRAANARGPRQTTSLDGTFAVDCDDADGITIAAGDVNGDGRADLASQAPRDAQSGMATGRRMHKPFVITKEWGAASPGLSITVTGKSKELTGHVTLIK